MTTNLNGTSDLAGERPGRHWERYMALDSSIDFIEAPETRSNEVFVNIDSSGPYSPSSLGLITQGHSQQYGSTPRESESLQDTMLLLPVAGLGPLISALMLRLQHAQTPTDVTALQGLLNSMNNMSQVLSILSLGRPTSPTLATDNTDPESGEPAESTEPPPYPNLTIFEWIMALIAHRRFEDTEDSEDSEECECGECGLQLKRVPTERPCASPDHKYKAPPPYSPPPEVDRPEAHQFRPLSSQE